MFIILYRYECFFLSICVCFFNLFIPANVIMYIDLCFPRQTPCRRDKHLASDIFTDPSTSKRASVEWNN